MSAKMKIDIGVDGGRFDSFKSKFDEFKSAMDEMPDAWRSTELASDAVRNKFEEAAAAMAGMSDDMNAMLENARKLDQASGSTSRHWKDLARNTASVAKNIAKATASLLKWAAITSIIGSLTGGGALFGLDKLAASTSADRTRSMGLGTTYGGLAAFRTQFGRLGDAEGILGRVGAALASPEGRSIFQQMGMGQNELNGDTADVATQAILRMKDTLDKIPKEQLATGMQAHRLDKLIDINTARVLKNMSREEVAGLAKGMPGLRKQLDLTPGQQLTWQNFLTKMERAGKIIQSTFINNLTALAGPLGNLTTSFSRLLETLLREGGPLQYLIGVAADGLDWLVKLFKPENKASLEAGIKDFETKLEGVGEWVARLGLSVEKIGTILSWLIGVPAAHAATGPYGEGSGGVGSAGRNGGAGGRGMGGSTGSGGHGGGTSPGGDWGTSSSAGNLTRLIDEEARKAGIDPRIMEGIRAGESAHSNRYDVKDDAIESSWGPFQLNRRRGLGVQFEKETGLDVRDPSTIPAQARWVARYIAKGGSLGAWMGYHGPRNADPRWGDSGYVPKKESAAPAQPSTIGPMDFARHTLAGRKVKVTVNNSTGASPVMLMNSAAAH